MNDNTTEQETTGSQSPVVATGSDARSRLIGEAGKRIAATEHDRGMTILALRWAREDARKARRGSPEQHDACGRAARLRISLQSTYGMTEAEVNEVAARLAEQVS